MKNGEEGTGSAGASPGSKTTHVAPILLVAQNVSRIAGLAGGCADGMEISQDVNRAGVIRILREVQTLADALLPATALPSAPSPQGEGPSNPYLGMTGKEIQQEVNRRQSAQVEKLAEGTPGRRDRE